MEFKFRGLKVNLPDGVEASKFDANRVIANVPENVSSLFLEYGIDLKAECPGAFLKAFAVNERELEEIRGNLKRLSDLDLIEVIKANPSNLQIRVFKTSFMKRFVELIQKGTPYLNADNSFVDYLLNNEILKKISNVLLISISIISFIVCMIWNNISLTYYWKYLHYDCIFLYVLTVCLFELFRRINFNKAVNCIRKLIDYISRYSLAIYFIHIIFIMLIGKYLVLYQIPAILKFVLLNVFTVICSFGLAWIISKIQLLKKLLLCIK